MLKLCFAIVLFTCFCGFSQVGIGTIEPQQDLHIAGQNSTIRIEKLNSVNSSQFNNGIKPSPAFVDGNGNISIYGGMGSGIQPINFLIDVPNFLEDNPYGYASPYDHTGIAVNNEVGVSSVEEVIDNSIIFTVPYESLIEIKYGVTLYVRGSDITVPPPFSEPAQGKAISILTYFCVDIDSDGLSGDELNKKYGIKGQYYETLNGGAPGNPYMNGQSYFRLPTGTHTLYFFGQVKDSSNSYTSVGFGGVEDYLKIRIYQ